MDWQPIETAPKDGSEVLMLARWDWGGMHGEKCGELYSWKVVAWGPVLLDDNDFCDEVFLSVTSNPYIDHAVKPTHWMPLPNTPKETT